MNKIKAAQYSFQIALKDAAKCRTVTAALARMEYWAERFLGDKRNSRNIRHALHPRVSRLVALGMSIGNIAERLEVSRSTIKRIKKELSNEANSNL